MDIKLKHILLIFLMIISFGCNKSISSQEASTFFKSSLYNNFIYNNALKQYEDGVLQMVDINEQKSFGSYMSNCDIKFDKLFLIEFYNEGETVSRTKLLVIEYNDSYYYHYYVYKSCKWQSKAATESQKKEFNPDILKRSKTNKSKPRKGISSFIYSDGYIIWDAIDRS